MVGPASYNAAYATGSNPAIDVVDTATGLITTTINIKADGTLDEDAISALGYAVSVTKVYDQTGNGMHLAQLTLASMPTVVMNAIGGRAALVFAGVGGLRKMLTFTATAQPLTVSVVAERSGTGGLGVFSDSAGNFDIYFKTGGTNAELYCGVSLDNPAGVSGAVYAIQAVGDGGSSDICVDGSSTIGNAGAGGLTNGDVIWGADGFGQSLSGKSVEAGVWPSAFSGGNKTAMNSNQHAYWGF